MAADSACRGIADTCRPSYFPRPTRSLPSPLPPLFLPNSTSPPPRADVDVGTVRHCRRRRCYRRMGSHDPIPQDSIPTPAAVATHDSVVLERLDVLYTWRHATANQRDVHKSGQPRSFLRRLCQRRTSHLTAQGSAWVATALLPLLAFLFGRGRETQTLRAAVSCGACGTCSASG